MLEPEALQLTNTAFDDPTRPQARNLATGAGVRVGFIADGIDIHQPDLVRADGSPVIVDYQDFSGGGVDAPSDGGEAFTDASSIGAQGGQTYDLANFVNPGHPLPAGCTIQVRGIAPGADLVALRVFSRTGSLARYIEAIDYAVTVAHVDVLNESFGSMLFPDNGDDPVTLATEAAVDAGVTVVTSTGDAGPAGTVESPAISPKVISVAATTQYRAYQQTGMDGVGLSTGDWVNGNVSPISSGGVTQQGRVPDLAAPGDSGWALCGPDPARFTGCRDFRGRPSPLQVTGGTSQSTPYTAGAAALVIEAYRKTHHGVRPSPALVKRLLTSTASDLGAPASEQGAGQVDTLAAVRAAMSWSDHNGSPVPQSSALVVDRTQLSVVGAPGATVRSALKVRNVGRDPQRVTVSTRGPGRVLSYESNTVTVDTATAPTYLEYQGGSLSYLTRTFQVPPGADRLAVAAAATLPHDVPRVILLDPQGAYHGYSVPQAATGYGEVEVAHPPAGQWTAILAVVTAYHFHGPLQYSVTTSAYGRFGAARPGSVLIPPGATASITVTTTLPAAPGDTSASVQLRRQDGGTVSVPLTARTLIPTGSARNTFAGTITGGDGRSSVAQTNVFAFDVPPGHRDLGVAVTLPASPPERIYAVLCGPDGQLYSDTSNISVDAAGTTTVGAGLQMYRRDPVPGRWTLSIHTGNPLSGAHLTQPFTGTLSFDTVRVTADLPRSPTVRYPAGRPVTIPMQITNTGPVPVSYFVDPRLDTVGEVRLADLSGTPATIPLPVPPGTEPYWLVPAETSQLTVAAAGTQPVNLDVYYRSGEPEHIAPPEPGNSATVRFDAPRVTPGLWFADVAQPGPFATTPPTGTASVSAVAQARLFDPAVGSSTGDVWQTGVPVPAGSTPPPAPSPVTVAPGATATVTVTITPVGAPGSTVSGHLYVDTFSSDTWSGDELVGLPYTYTVG